MKIDTIIFDLGGVLLDWNPMYVYAADFNGDEKALHLFLEEIGFKAWNQQMDAGKPFDESVAELSAKFPQYAHLIEKYHHNWQDSIGGALEDTVAILAQLKQQGYTLYALSNWSAEKFSLMRDKYAFLNWFDDLIISGEEGMIKPDPRIYDVVLQRAGKQAEACVFIDDSEHNTIAAEKLGFATILFTSAQQTAADLRRMGIMLAE